MKWHQLSAQLLKTLLKENIFKSLFILLLSAILISACNPYEFRLKKNTGLPLGGLILSHMDSVEVVSDSTIKIFPGGKATIAGYWTTQFEMEFTTTVTRGEGISFILRSNGNTASHDSALRFEYSVNGSRMLLGNSTLFKNDTVRASLNVPQKVRITHYGDLTRIEVGCDRVFEIHTKIPATEYTTLETLPGSEVLLANIAVERTRSGRWAGFTPLMQ